VLPITWADRLHAGWTAARRIRRDHRSSKYASHIERLLTPLPRDCGIVTVLDGHPATLGWLGGVCGHRMEALGVEHFGQTGTIPDLYRHYSIEANDIIDAAEGLTGSAPVGIARWRCSWSSRRTPIGAKIGLATRNRL
jgi:pyruvate dehydrogenase E1 component